MGKLILILTTFLLAASCAHPDSNSKERKPARSAFATTGLECIAYVK
jgi:hypothetical protein